MLTVGCRLRNLYVKRISILPYHPAPRATPTHFRWGLNSTDRGLCDKDVMKRGLKSFSRRGV